VIYAYTVGTCGLYARIDQSNFVGNYVSGLTSSVRAGAEAAMSDTAHFPDTC